MERDLAFADFYDEEGEKVNTERLVDFLQRVMNWQNNKSENEYCIFYLRNISTTALK